MHVLRHHVIVWTAVLVHEIHRASTDIAGANHVSGATGDHTDVGARRGVANLTVTSVKAIHDVITLNAVHRWQDAWEDGRVLLQISASLRLVHRSLHE